MRRWKFKFTIVSRHCFENNRVFFQLAKLLGCSLFSRTWLDLWVLFVWLQDMIQAKCQSPECHLSIFILGNLLTCEVIWCLNYPLICGFPLALPSSSALCPSFSTRTVLTVWPAWSSKWTAALFKPSCNTANGRGHLGPLTSATWGQTS